MKLLHSWESKSMRYKDWKLYFHFKNGSPWPTKGFKGFPIGALFFNVSFLAPHPSVGRMARRKRWIDTMNNTSAPLPTCSRDTYSLLKTEFSGHPRTLKNKMLAFVVSKTNYTWHGSV